MAATALVRTRQKVVTTKRTRAMEKGKLPNGRWRATFLAVLAETSNVSKSAEAAEVSTARAYKVRREQPDFRRAWQEALCEGFEHLELELLRRLREGDFGAPGGGKYDFANALRILAAHRGTIVNERARQDDEEESAVFASIRSKIEAIRREREQAAVLTSKAEDGDAG